MNLQHWLTNVIAHYPVLVYAVIVVVSYVEGPILAVACGVLYRLGFFHIVPVYLALMFGDLIGDCFWYFMGYRYGHRFIRRFGRFVNIHEKDINRVEHIFRMYSNWILIISKLTMGLGFALVTLFTAGLSKIPFRQYLTLNVVGQFFWTTFLLVIGYAFGHMYVSFNNIFARIFLVSLIVIVFALLFGFSKYVKRRMTSKVHEYDIDNHPNA